METLKYFIPIVSFILGAVFTLFLKKRERKELIIAKASEELADLATNWYSQLYDILAASRREDHDTAEKLLAEYSQNRIVLPKYIRTMEVLRNHHEARELAVLGEQFLSSLTRPTRTNDAIACRSLFVLASAEGEGSERVLPMNSLISEEFIALLLECAPLLKEQPHVGVVRGKSLMRLDEYLQHLDGIVQRINREAGKLT